MSGIFNAQRAAYCGLVLAGVPVGQAMVIARTSKKTLANYLGPDWLKGQRVTPLPHLPLRERARAIFDYHRSERRTLQETASVFGVSREYVRQILVRQGIFERAGAGASPEVKTAALKAYRDAIAAGSSAADAEARAGYDRATLRLWLGAPLPKKRSLRRERWPEIAAFYKEHTDLLQSEVADHFGVSQNEVSKALKEMGVRSRWWKSPESAARRHAPRSRPAQQDAA